MLRKTVWVSWMDLLLAVLCVGAASLLVFLTPGTSGLWRAALALPAVLVVPGYLLTLTLFPGRADLGGRDRAALSLGYSLMAVPLLGLLLSALPWGVTPRTLALGLCLWTAVLGSAAGWRRHRQPASGAFSVTWPRDGVRAAAPLLAVSLGALIALGALMRQWHAGTSYSEFYLLGPGGELSGYPTHLRAGAPVSLTLGIRNLEGRATSYRIQPSLCGKALPVPTLPPRQEWRIQWRCQPGRLEKATTLRFDLYRTGDSAPYRTLALHLR